MYIRTLESKAFWKGRVIMTIQQARKLHAFGLRDMKQRLVRIGLWPKFRKYYLEGKASRHGKGNA